MCATVAMVVTVSPKLLKKYGIDLLHSLWENLNDPKTLVFEFPQETEKIRIKCAE